MNDENDKILDELISYYDNVDDDFSGDTTMIPPIKSEEAPKDETLGDTMVVKPITPKEPIAEEATTEETTVINVPLSEEPQATINIPLSEEPEIPQDEVFGNLDIDGNIITTPQEDMMRRAIDLWERLSAEHNRYTKPWESDGVVTLNAFESQALLQLSRKYCDHKLCTKCPLGRRLLKK